jgi:hypothetical protein
MKRFFVHEADHEYPAGNMVLDDGGNEAIEFGVIEIHAYQRKSPRFVAAGLIALGLETWHSEHDPLRRMPVMVVMGVQEHEFAV